MDTPMSCSLDPVSQAFQQGYKRAVSDALWSQHSSARQHPPALSGLPHPAFSGLCDPVFGGSPVLPGLQQGYGVFLPGPAFSRPVSPVLSRPGSPRATSWRHRWEVHGQAIANMRDVMEASLGPVSPVVSPILRPGSPVSGSVGHVSPVLTAQRGLSPVGGVILAPFSSGILQMPPQAHTAFQDYQDAYLGWKMQDRRLIDDVLMHPLISHIDEQGIRPLSYDLLWTEGLPARYRTL